jgi:hypothetical protein
MGTLLNHDANVTYVILYLIPIVHSFMVAFVFFHQNNFFFRSMFQNPKQNLQMRVSFVTAEHEASFILLCQ